MLADEKHCQFCGNVLGLTRGYVFQVENQRFEERFAHDPELLERIRNSPFHHGEPLRICEACYRDIQDNAEALAQEPSEKEVAACLLKTLFWLGIGAIALSVYSCLRG